MTPNEKALHAMRTQVQFELLEAAAEVSQAMTLGARTQQEVDAAMRSCESAVTELRNVMGRSQVNPALLMAMRRFHQGERAMVHAAQTRLAAAQQREEQARSVLTSVRNRERSLDRALRAERNRRRLKQQALDIVQSDDLWLQHAWRQLP
jgi:hypothetical protein